MNNVPWFFVVCLLGCFVLGVHIPFWYFTIPLISYMVGFAIGSVCKLIRRKHS